MSFGRRIVVELNCGSILPQSIQSSTNAHEKRIDLFLCDDERRGHRDQIANAAHNDPFFARNLCGFRAEKAVRRECGLPPRGNNSSAPINP
jgi:hypothetical protein